MWTLILNYSISKPIPPSFPKQNGSNGASEEHNGTNGDSNNTGRSSRESTPKQRLLAWIKDQLPAEVPVTNFTSDWNDGLLLGALLNACVPGACPDWRTWSPSDSLNNTKKAMYLAEEWLGVERVNSTRPSTPPPLLNFIDKQLITAEEITSPAVDEKSVVSRVYASKQPHPESPTYSSFR